MPRKIDTTTLDGAARHYAAAFLHSDLRSPSGKVWVDGPSYVMQDFYNFTYKDEFEYLINQIKEWLGGKALSEFETRAKATFKPREDAVFARLLKEKLAIDLDGNHIEGVVGTVQIGNRWVGRGQFIVETLESIHKRKARKLPIHVEGRNDRDVIQVTRSLAWPVYAGETEERVAGRVRDLLGIGEGVDPLPQGADPWPVGMMFATNPNISAEAAIAACDAIVDRLDEGSTAATIRGRTGTQPADPDASETGTLLFTLTMSDPAFGNAADNTPGGLATASSITDDSSADATGTLGYCRCGATGTGADDHIDGEADSPSGGDFNFNTLSITSGSTVSMSSFTVEVPQGSTAT